MNDVWCCPVVASKRHRPAFHDAVQAGRCSPYQSTRLSRYDTVFGDWSASMRRREFITFLGGAAATWPLAARAQKGETRRRIAVLMGTAATGQGETYLASFLQRLEELRWVQGRNLTTNVRWWADGQEQMRTAVAEQLAFSPDVFVAWSNLALELLKPMAGKVPIVFAGVGDPLGSGFVASLNRPGGNITGFVSFDGPMGGKWLEVLKETAPHLRRVMAILHPDVPPHPAFWHSIKEAAPRLGVEVTPGAVHDAVGIESAISSFPMQENGGIIVPVCDHPGQRESYYRAGTAASPACGLPQRRLRHGRRARLLRPRLRAQLSSDRRICGPHSSRGEARRPSGAAAEQV